MGADMSHTQAQDKDEGTQAVDLSGRRILFVGGRHRAVAHMRRLVEDSNGAFMHHDGGVEESMNRLGGLLRRADAVLFPVECVSHSALATVKLLCRRFDKPYVPLRSAGTLAVIAALQTLAPGHVGAA
jgi:hypothetical protein